MASKKNVPTTKASQPSSWEADAAKYAANTMTVFCNMPNGISFDLPSGKRLTFNGYPVSKLVGPDGEALPAGQFGRTDNVPREEWEWVRKVYGECAFFNTPNGPLLFEATNAPDARAKADEFKDTRHGLEQIDVTATPTKAERK